MNLLRDLGFIDYSFSGAPCQTLVSSLQSNFVFTGEGSEYTGPVNIKGSTNVIATNIQQRNHDIHSDRIFAGPFNLNYPETNQLNVQGNYHDPNIMTIHTIPLGATVSTRARYKMIYSLFLILHKWRQVYYLFLVLKGQIKCV